MKVILLFALLLSGVAQASGTTDAVEGYRQACDGGDVEACYNLALLYDEGDGVKEDVQKNQHIACGGIAFIA